MRFYPGRRSESRRTTGACSRSDEARIDLCQTNIQANSKTPVSCDERYLFDSSHIANRGRGVVDPSSGGSSFVKEKLQIIREFILFSKWFHRILHIYLVSAQQTTFFEKGSTKPIEQEGFMRSPHSPFPVLQLQV